MALKKANRRGRGYNQGKAVPQKGDMPHKPRARFWYFAGVTNCQCGVHDKSTDVSSPFPACRLDAVAVVQPAFAESGGAVIGHPSIKTPAAAQPVNDGTTIATT